RDEAGEPHHFISQIMDIDASKQQDLDLQRLTGKLRGLTAAVRSEGSGLDRELDMALERAGGSGRGTADMEVSGVAALVAALEARRAPMLAANGPVSSLHPPLVLRPDDATPMKALYSAVASIAAAREDFVLAARRDGEWALLRPMSLPIPPVPFNTGGAWSPQKRTGRAGEVSAEPPPRLSLFADRDRTIWIGVTGTRDFQKFAAEPAQLENVLAALKAHKASAPFGDRADLEVAGASDVAYKDLVALIDTAAKAGFLDWRLTDEAHLAARPTR
ncbi:MAG: hypothetical protein KIT31_30250, partial [Deltaproteobacteria bacterium]|nr:hypothetical protein [Deltaproteobacteria bacterium]